MHMATMWELHRRSVVALRTVSDGVTPADLVHPTPCAGWDLRALLEHMTGQDHGFAAALTAAREGTDTVVADFAPRPLGPDPAATVATGLDGVLVAFAVADGLERPVLLPEFDRRVPATTVAGMHLVDTLVHGWDVAATLGTADAFAAVLDDETVAAGLAVAEQVPGGDHRTAPGATFGPVVASPDGADPWVRTLSLLGRDPAWTASPHS